MERIKIILGIILMAILMILGVSTLAIAQLFKIAGLLASKLIRIVGLSIMLQFDRVLFELKCSDIREELEDFITI
jgi:hypothetical protein